MLFLTQLVYIHPGKEAVFHEFENVAIPLLRKYGGELLVRVRPDPQSIVAAAIEVPYEIHIVRFDSEEEFARFVQDEDRQRFLHLKNESVRTTLVIKGAAM